MSITFMKTCVVPFGIAPSEERQALQLVEICGRTAYKSEDKITDDSARSFVLMLKKHGHLSVLEHSNIVLVFHENAQSPQTGDRISLGGLWESLFKWLGPRNAYHRICMLPDSGGLAVSGSFRAWIETLQQVEESMSPCADILKHHLNRYFPNIFPDAGTTAHGGGFSTSLLAPEQQLQFLKQDSGSDLPLFVFKFICDRGITHEVVRHRVLSFTQESTRYVNYRNKGMALILPEELEPCFVEEAGTFIGNDPIAREWMDRAETLFHWYQADLARGLRPEIARDILPNLLKSEIFVSGRWSGWKHFVLLRDSPQAHPRIRAIAGQVRKHFEGMGMSF
ncbi:MAG: FAD-dependent thymidylate synthase [Syntrophobacteraceae bacterium]|nr:FAD-dependent thymidylate synthase [Desulfobacteraceae bacterium]